MNNTQHPSTILGIAINPGRPSYQEERASIISYFETEIFPCNPKNVYVLHAFRETSSFLAVAGPFEQSQWQLQRIICNLTLMNILTLDTFAKMVALFMDHNKKSDSKIIGMLSPQITDFSPKETIHMTLKECVKQPNMPLCTHITRYCLNGTKFTETSISGPVDKEDKDAVDEN